MKLPLRHIRLLILLCAVSNAGIGGTSLVAQALAPCGAWGVPETVGRLDPRLLDEASGLETSSDFPGRLYHINDSGDRGRFTVTDSEGGGARRVVIRGFDPLDTEDLTLGPCDPDGATCLFVADIGDNRGRRPQTEVIVVPELEQFAESVDPQRRIRLRYPDGSRDAESIAVHPNGDLFVLTKAAQFLRLSAAPSILYRVRYEQWAQNGSDVLVAERIGELDLTAISSDPFSGSLPTGMDISADGRRLLVLTYLNAFEFQLDLSVGSLTPARDMVDGVDYREIELTPLEQQESIAYLPSGDGFIYTTEAGGRDGVAIMRVSCLPTEN